MLKLFQKMQIGNFMANFIIKRQILDYYFPNMFENIDSCKDVSLIFINTAQLTQLRVRSLFHSLTHKLLFHIP